MLNGKFAEVSLVASGMVVEAAKKCDYVVTSHSAQPASCDWLKLKEAFIAVARQDIAEVLSGGA